MSDLNWEVHAFSPDDDPAAFVEMCAAHGQSKATRFMDRPAQVAYRLSTVESSIPEGQTLEEWRHRSA